VLSIFSYTLADYASTVHYLFSSIDGDMGPLKSPINGTIPSWLNVDRYGNGFGKFEGGKAKGGEPWKWNFLFDVTAYTHKWKVRGSEVEFIARITNSSYHTQGLEHMPLERTFGGTTPEMNLMQKAETLTSLSGSDNFNVNIVQVGKKMFAISDMAGEMVIDQDTLNTVGKMKWNDTISTEKIAMITCAHPSQLPEDPYVYNYIVNLDPSHFMDMYETQFYRIDTRKEPMTREIVWTQATGHAPPYMHQFAHTPNYLILFEYPLWWHEMGIAASTTVLPNMHWSPENGTKIQVVDKRTWTVAGVFWTDPFFAYHHLNAWEEDSTGEIVVDIMRIPCEGVKKGDGNEAECLHMNSFNMKTLPVAGFNVPRGSLRRFRVPIVHGTPNQKIGYEDINQLGIDLYAIHPSLKGHKYRYVWAMGNHGEGVWWNSIVKIDHKTNQTLEWWKEDHYPSEVSFIPRPGAVDEDDGVLISTVLGVPQGHSYLLVLNATDLTQIATAAAPGMLPFPSHGHSCAPINGKEMCFWG